MTVRAARPRATLIRVTRRLIALASIVVLLVVSGCATEAAARDRLLNWARGLAGLSDVQARPMTGAGGSRGITLEGHVGDTETARSVLSAYEGYIAENNGDFQWWDARLSWPVEGGLTVAQLTPGEDMNRHFDLGEQPLPDGVRERRIGYSTFALGSGQTPGLLTVELEAEDPVAVTLSLEAMLADHLVVGADFDHYLGAADLEELRRLALPLQRELEREVGVRYQGARLIYPDTQEAVAAARRLGERTAWTITGGVLTLHSGPGTHAYLTIAQRWREQARRIVISEREFEVWMRTVDDCNAFLNGLPRGRLPVLLDCLDEDYRLRVAGSVGELRAWRGGLDRLLQTGVGSVQYSASTVRIYQRGKDWEEPLKALRAMNWPTLKEIELSTETVAVTFTSTAAGLARQPTHRGEPIEPDGPEAELVQAWNDSQN